MDKVIGNRDQFKIKRAGTIKRDKSLINGDQLNKKIWEQNKIGIIMSKSDLFKKSGTN